MKQVAKFLARLKFCPDVILTSPLPRASQTAEIAAEDLDCKVQVEPQLAHGFNLERLQGMLAKMDASCVMIVGHEPDFSAVVKELTGGEVKLAKAGVALIETDRNCRSGELRWLFTPKFAKVATE
jgi:phosphohistidine phosphatase